MWYPSRKKSTLFKRGLILIACAALMAGGLGTRASAEDFTGIYVGPEVGFIHSNDNVVGDLNGVYFGGVAGGRIGVGPGVVAGVEGYFGGSSQDTVFLATPFDMDRIYGVDGVLGVPIAGNALLFGTIGYSNMRFRGERDGVRFGAGLEVSLTNSVSARGKVNYGDFDGLKSVSANAGLLFKF